MIQGKLASGFEYEIASDLLDNMELVDAIVEADENPLAVSRVVKLLLGEDQRRKLYDHLRTEKGNVPMLAVSEAVAEIFRGSGQQAKLIALAGMISADRDALVCDLAETYGIFDFRALPVSLLATLAVGLRDDSRIKMRLAGAKVPRSELLLAAIVDRLSMLLWAQTEDGRKGVNRPRSVFVAIQGDEKKDGPVESFDSADDFESAWTKITGVSHGW